jgi:hypothetical protein
MTCDRKRVRSTEEERRVLREDEKNTTAQKPGSAMTHFKKARPGGREEGMHGHGSGPAN